MLPRTEILAGWLQVLASVGSLLSGLGLLGTVVAVLLLLRQTRAVEHASQATAYQNIIAMGNAVNRLHFEHPELFDVLMNRIDNRQMDVRPWDIAEETREHPQRFGVAAQVVDFFEVIFITIPALPRPLQEEWRDYVAKQLKRSSYLRRVILDTGWYIADLEGLAQKADRAATEAAAGPPRD